MSVDRRKMGNKILLLLGLVAYFTVAYAVLGYFDIACVFLELLGIPCPGCGMTRAALSLLKFDFIGAVRHNVVVFFMPYVFVYVFFDLRHKIHKVLLGIIALIAAANWAIKIALFI